MGSSVLGHVGISVGFSFWDVLWEEIPQGAPGEAGLVAATQTIKETSPLVSRRRLVDHTGRQQPSRYPSVLLGVV